MFLNFLILNPERGALLHQPPETFHQKNLINGWLNAEAQKTFFTAGFAPAVDQRTCQTCETLQLSLQKKTPHKPIPSRTSAANLTFAFLQFALFNIHRGYDLPGQRWKGTVGRENWFLPYFCPRSRHGGKKTWGLTKSELEQRWLNWANLRG